MRTCVSLSFTFHCIHFQIGGAETVLRVLRRPRGLLFVFSLGRYASGLRAHETNIGVFIIYSH